MTISNPVRSTTIMPMLNHRDEIDSSLLHRELKKLLQQVRSGDSIALGCVLERYRPFLLQIANDTLNPPLKQKVGASDVVQQSLLEAGQSICSFDGDSPDALAGWLRRILLNNVANLRRHFLAKKRNIHREVRLVGSDSTAYRIDGLIASPLPTDDLRHQEEILSVERALNQLPADYRMIIQLRGCDKKTFQEIGDLIGRSPDAARKLWGRAVEALKLEVDRPIKR